MEVLIRFLVAALLAGCALFDDIRRYRISNRIILAGGGIQLMMLTADLIMGRAWMTYVLGGAAAFVLMLCIYLLGGVGAGDVKLLGLLGCYMGLIPGMLLVAGAVIAGAVVGLSGILWRTCRSTELALPGEVRWKTHGFHFTIAIVMAQSFVTVFCLGGGIYGA